MEHDLAAITNCFKETAMDSVIFTYIIVSKWSNIVLLKSSGKSCNPPRGTVVDDVERWVTFQTMLVN